ncbi:TonB-dependent receptor [Belliella sp. DSM 107340]|uniref:TonB-dependent receptor n=1 Tax=Belliella calami TaxID=2923436 RepID=A0ABS9UNF7_9BACT|nr:TonB-dependent receptor [Belliella calami]MCH7398146.1 TonB-dependent receptor [Belliella calami]
MFRIDLNKLNVIILLFLLVVNFSVLADRKGVVEDIDGKSIPFASITWSQERGVVADEKGHFSIPDTLKNQKIRVSAIGYETSIMDINDSTSIIKVQLSPNTTELTEVVVTGYIDPQSAKQSVYQVRTISKDIIKNRAVGNIQEVLNTELGIRFSQDNAVGSSNLEMMGMAGQNIKVLIDGVPMVGRQGVNNEININQIDVNQIERIEIVEGPMSVVYGADALAGVINIITKRPETSKFLLNARIQEESVGSDYQFAQGKGNHIRSIQSQWGLSEKWSFGLGYTNNAFGGWKGENIGRQFAWLPRNQHLANTQVNFNNNNVELNYSLDYLNETITSYGPENRVEVIDSEFLTKRWMHRLNGTYTFSPNVKTSVQAGFTNYTRETITKFTNIRTGEQGLATGPDSQAKLQYSGLNFRSTTYWKLANKLALSGGLDLNYEEGQGDRISENEGIADLAAFLSAEWKPTDKLSIRPGIRSTYNSAYTAPPIIPSVNGRFNITDALNFKFGYARGFRAPSIRELYFNFFDASHSIIGNPDLKAETSHSFNTSLAMDRKVSDKVKVESSLSGFYNDVKNQITYGISPEDPRLTSLFNLEEFKTGGLMIRNKILLGKSSLDLGVSRIGRFNRISSEIPALEPMLWSTEINSNLGIYLPFADSYLNVFYKWTGALPAFVLDTESESGARAVQMDGFHWMDFTFKKSLFGNLDFTVGVRNLLDIKNIQSNTGDGSAHSGGASRPVGYGRSYFIGMNYQLFK